MENREKNGSQIEAFKLCPPPPLGSILSPSFREQNSFSAPCLTKHRHEREVRGDFRLRFAEAGFMKQSFPDQLVNDLSGAGGVAQPMEGL